MMDYSYEGRSANAIGGKTARACENCLKKRARWFCGADDAFLCQSCDTSVHSANQLASRHERVRLETSSFKSSTQSLIMKLSAGGGGEQPVWHTRKARTPRHKNNNKKKENKVNNINIVPLVPEIGGDQESCCLDENEEEQLLMQYQVPVFEPLLFVDDHHSTDQKETRVGDHDNNNDDLIMGGNHELNFFLDNDDDNIDIDIDLNTCGMELMGSDAELADFAADVENLLGTEVASLGEDLTTTTTTINFCNNLFVGDHKRSSPPSVKIEVLDHEASQLIDPATNYYLAHPSSSSAAAASSLDGEDLKDIKNNKIKMGIFDKSAAAEEEQEEEEEGKMRIISLKLNYEEVITAWDNNSQHLMRQGCPWINGIRPDFDPADNSWPDHFLQLDNINGTYEQYGYGGCRNEEREARVSRYREKRRTRLFSKKIRYEVRKLNAEKRPRMKGRFVKRTALATTTLNS